MTNNINKTQYLLDYQADGQTGYDSPHGLSGQYYSKPFIICFRDLFYKKMFFTRKCLYKTCLVHEIY